MQKEGDKRHYSDQPGHKARSDFWKEVRREQRVDARRRNPNELTIFSRNFSRLVGHEVLHCEPNK